MYAPEQVGCDPPIKPEGERENLYLEFGHFGSTDPFHAPKWRQFQCSDVNSFSFLLRKEDQGNCANHTEEMGTESRGTY